MIFSKYFLAAGCLIASGLAVASTVEQVQDRAQQVARDADYADRLAKGNATKAAQVKAGVAELLAMIDALPKPYYLHDATHNDQFRPAGIPNLGIRYHVSLDDRSPSLLALTRGGGVMDAVALDRDALHNSTQSEPDAVDRVVAKTLDQVEWIREQGGQARYYNALPMSGNYNFIRMDPAGFWATVVVPILPLLDALPTIDTPCYFGEPWYAEWAKFAGSRREVAEQLAVIGERLGKPVAVWLWVRRYKSPEHLAEHVAELRGLGLGVVLWESEQVDQTFIEAVKYGNSH